MSSIKIITVLRHDTLPEIMELFRQAPGGEVIFVLPKTGALFAHEDHFAAFASEAATGNKTVTLLTSNPEIAALAHKYKFSVMAAGKPKPTAALATASFASDDALQDFNDGAVQDDDGVVPTSDQITHAPQDEEEEALEGFRIVDPEGSTSDEPADDDLEPSDADAADEGELVASENGSVVAQLAAVVDGVRQGTPRRSIRVASGGRAKAAPIPVQAIEPSESPSADLDYIDTVWRNKMSRTAASVPSPTTGFSAPERGASAPESTRAFRFGLPRRSFNIGSKRMLAGAVGISLCVLIAAIFTISGSAHVNIIPVARSVDIHLQVQSSDAFPSIDSTFAKIPGQRISLSKTGSKTVPATGSRDVASKARGRLTLSNTYSSTPQTLVATTRFASADGKVFRSLQTVSIPGSTIKNGAVVAGTIQVDVIADRPGTDYNIPAGAFTVVAFTERGDTDRASKITAASSAAMTGGASGPSKVVTKADYDAAYADALAQATEEITQTLQAQGSDLTVLQADTPTVSEVHATAKQDDAADETTVSVTVELTTVAFRAEDLSKLIAETALQKERLVIDEKFITVSTSESSFDQATNILTFSATITGTGFQPIDTPTIIRDIAGKNKGQVREYLQSRDDIRSATVELTPFWISEVPRDSKDSKVVIIHQETP